MKKIYLLSFFLFFPFLFAAAQEDVLFWFVCPNISQTPGLNLDRPIHLYLTAYAAPATVTISQPAGGGFPTTVITIPANGTTSFDMTPWLTMVENAPANTVLNYGIKIQSTAPISAYYYVIGGPSCLCNPEDFILKGGNAIGTDFWIPGQDTLYNDLGYSPIPTNAFDIVATQNGTVVTITPSNDIVGHLAGTTFTVNLNMGQTYSATAVGNLGPQHLHGSHVTSNKPIAITEKDDLLGFRSSTTGVYGADLIGDQIVPVNVLGTEYIPMYGNLDPNGDKIFVTATQNGTIITLGGTYITTINAGQTYRMNCPKPSGYLQTSFPAYVYQLSGIEAEVGSALLPQINCTGSSLVQFYQSSTIDFKLNLLVKNGGQGNFLVNGAAGVITAGMFAPVPGTGGAWYSAQVIMPVSSYPIASVFNVSNTTNLFQLGYLSSGPPRSGASFGYFSNYGGINPNPFAKPDICAGDSLFIFSDTISSATYYWTGPNGFTSTLQNPFIAPALAADSGVYQIVVNTPGCTDSGLVTVAVHPYPIVDLGNDTTVCNSTPIVLQDIDPVYTGYTYEWNTFATTSSITISTSGTYWLAVSNSGCVAADTIKVTELPPIHPDFTFALHEGCASSRVDFTNIAPWATSYRWDFGDGSTANEVLTTSHVYSAQGTYNVILTGYVPPCDGDTTITIDIHHTITADFTVAPDTFCAGSSVTFTNTSTPASALSGYLWKLGDGSTDGAESATPHVYNTAGVYPVTLVITDTLGCKDSATKDLIALSIGIKSNDTMFCYGKAVRLNNMVSLKPDGIIKNISYSYSWAPRAGLDDTSVQHPSFTGAGSFTYIYSVTLNSFGCVATDTMKINSVKPQPLLYVTQDETIAYGSSAQLNADSAVYYRWKPDDGTLNNPNINNPVATPTNTTLYTVYGYDRNGCLDSAFVTIYVDSNMSECIPTAFTPNGDGLNDIFRPACIKFQNVVDFRVYNRWGQELFYSNNYKAGWDGTFNGVPQDLGVYYYVIIVARPGSQDLVYKGNVTLIR